MDNLDMEFYLSKIDRYEKQASEARAEATKWEASSRENAKELERARDRIEILEERLHGLEEGEEKVREDI